LVFGFGGVKSVKDKKGAKGVRCSTINAGREPMDSFSDLVYYFLYYPGGITDQFGTKGPEKRFFRCLLFPVRSTYITAQQLSAKQRPIVFFEFSHHLPDHLISLFLTLAVRCLGVAELTPPNWKMLYRESVAAANQPQNN